MRVFYCNDFKGICPTKTAAVMVATNRAHARRLLDAELKSSGLPGLRNYDIVQELNTHKTQVVVLADGDY